MGEGDKLLAECVRKSTFARTRARFNPRPQNGDWQINIAPLRPEIVMRRGSKLRGQDFLNINHSQSPKAAEPRKDVIPMLGTFEQAALEAGKAILAIYRAGCLVTLKQDLSPVTVADEQAERIIIEHLAREFPDIPIIAEESVAAGRIPDVRGRPFFLVDPLDGTREFVEQRDEFTVNIAYIEDGVPIAGIVYAPAVKLAFTGAYGKAQRLSISDEFSVFERSDISVRRQPKELLALASRRYNNAQTDRFLLDNAVTACTTIGSSLKFCLLAEGQADVYPRFSRTMEWDTAAGDAILRAAGGMTVTGSGQPLLYGKTEQSEDSDFANPDFISWGCRASRSRA